MRTRIKTLQDCFLPEYRNITRSGCWEWTGSTDPYGYGFFRRDGKDIRVHRYVLEGVLGRPLGDEHALHRCDNPPCFNPSHLFAGSHAENMEDRDSKGRHVGRRGKSGEKGIVWVQKRNRWRVLRYQSGRQATFGEFENLSDALNRNAQLRKERGEIH